MESYNTIKNRGTGTYKEKGSKFLGFSFPVDSEQEVKDRLSELRKEYHDARHHCYAYILGEGSQLYKANDDGEPNHSAGDPILGQIRSKELTYALVVVIRYFGGTKLGVSGLINAYKTAAAEALGSSSVVKKLITIPVRLEFPYDTTNQVMSLISEFNLKTEKQEYQESCMIEGSLQPKFREALTKRSALVPQLKVTFD